MALRAYKHEVEANSLIIAFCHRGVQHNIYECAVFFADLCLCHSEFSISTLADDSQALTGH